MNRRLLVLGASAAVVRWPATRAQTRRVRRIGILALGEPGHIAGPQPGSPDVAAFVEAMGDLGYAWAAISSRRRVVRRDNRNDMDSLAKSWSPRAWTSLLLRVQRCRPCAA